MWCSFKWFWLWISIFLFGHVQCRDTDRKDLSGNKSVWDNKVISNDLFNRNRQKRGILSTGVEALIGLKATKTLLRGTKPLPHRIKMNRDFEKPGNYHQALRDFYSVNPTSVRHVNMQNGDHGDIGTVGNRILALVTAGENTIGQPTIRIAKLDVVNDFEPDKGLNRSVDRIIYSD